jgi:hypothetical protein
MKGKGLFNAHTMGYLSYSIRGIHITVFPFDNHTLKNLYPLLVSLDNADVDLYGITGTKLRVIKPHLLLIDSVKY